MVVHEQQILDHIKRLNDIQRQQVLNYIRALEPDRPQGTPGSLLKRFIGSIPAADLDRMEQAIEADLSQVDPDAW